MNRPRQRHLFRAIGCTRAKLLGSTGLASGSNTPFSAISTGPSDNFVVFPPGVHLNEDDTVASVADALYDMEFCPKTFKCVKISHFPMIETAVQLCNLLPKEHGRRFNEAIATINRLNTTTFGEQFFRTQTLMKNSSTAPPHLLPSLHIARDAIIFRPQTRGKGGKNPSFCSHCLRTPSITNRLKPGFTVAKESFQTNPVTQKKICEKCYSNYTGKTDPLFQFTRDHFCLGGIMKKSASRRAVHRPGKKPITLAQLMASIFTETDKRELVGYTYDKSYLTEARDRQWCGALRMAMPIGVFFCERAEQTSRQHTSKRSTIRILGAVFRHDPDRAVALWNLEHKPYIYWSSQLWYELSSAGRTPIIGSECKLSSLYKDVSFFRISTGMTWSKQQLLVWVEKNSMCSTDPDPTTEFPFMVTRTTIALLYLVFVEQRVSIKMVLDSNTCPKAPKSTQLMSLDLSDPACLNGTKLVLTRCENLTLDYLFWILDRPCVLGKLDMVDIELHGNYSQAVKNTSQDTFGYNLGHAFVDLVDYGMAERKKKPISSFIAVESEPTWCPNTDFGEEERCGELTLSALKGDTWPPALSSTRKQPKVAFKDVVNIVIIHAREFDTVWPSVCNSFALELDERHEDGH